MAVSTLPRGAVLLILFLTLFNTLPSVASTLIKNITGYTFQQSESLHFVAVAFEGDRITGVFQTLPDESQFNRVIDGKGATLVPGMIDAHGHVYRYGEALSRIILNDSVSKQQALNLVKQFAGQHKNEKWFTGGGWNQELWPDKAFPDADSLSLVTQGKPAALLRIDGHAIWVNNEALSIAGINKDTPSPEGGEILKDAQGNPTGVLVDNAMNLMFAHMPKPGLKETKDTLELSLETLSSLGLTSVHDAGVDYLTWQAYQALSDENRLPIRVYVMIDVTDPHYKKMLEQGFVRSKDDKLFIRSVKISSDGALGSRGAALIKEYSDKPGHVGLLLHDIDTLERLTLEAMKAGFQVNTHAIGDKANVVTLNAFQKSINVTKSGELRHRVEHAQVLHPSDFTRFKKLGVIASVQPTHATSDKNMAETRLGSDRIKGAYAWQRLLDHGAVLAGGSDFPIEPAEPLFGIHAAVTRQDRNNRPAGGWYKNEGITLSQAFHAFTWAAAYSAHQEQLIGSIEPGKKADFVLLKQDPFFTPPEDLWRIQVLQTWVGGELVWNGKN